MHPDVHNQTEVPTRGAALVADQRMLTARTPAAVRVVVYEGVDNLLIVRRRRTGRSRPRARKT